MPERLGKFRILELLAAGGMGEVYLGQHVDLATRVAIKLLPLPPGDDPTELRRRFRREAKLTAAIDHPGVVQVLDLCEDGGRLYLVLELVAGRSLRSLLRDGPVPLDDARRILLGVGRVVAAAHDQGVVHRDIKPENVMVMPDGGVRVLDFGLARALQDSEPLTHTGEILGTPEYMAPEQLLDTAEATTPRTDVHALGVLAYELLTGRSPFAGQSMFQALKLVESLVPPPPSHALQGSATVPEGVDEVVLSALAKDPSQRAGDAGAWTTALADAWPGVDAPAQHLATATRPWMPWALAAAGLTLGAWMGFWLGSIASRAAEPGNPKRLAAGATVLSPRDALRLDLEASMAELAARPWSPADATAAHDTVAQIAAIGNLPTGPAAVATAQVLLRLGQPHRALPMVERACQRGTPGARATAVACWFAAHAVVPKALEWPPWLEQVDLRRRDRLLGEPASPDSDPELHAWQRLASGHAQDGWTFAAGLPDDQRTASTTLLLALCLHQICDLPHERPGHAGAHFEGFASPLVEILVRGPITARDALDAARRDAPPQFADRWLYALAANGVELPRDPRRARRMDALTEQAWLAGSGDVALVWNAGLQGLLGRDRARVEELLRQLAPIDLAASPGAVMATVLALAHAEGQGGIGPLLAQAPDAASSVPFLAFWERLGAGERGRAVSVLTHVDPRPTPAAPRGDVEATLGAIAVLSAPDAGAAAWKELTGHDVDWAAVRDVVWVDGARDQGGISSMIPAQDIPPSWREAVSLAARAGVPLPPTAASMEGLCRVPE